MRRFNTGADCITRFGLCLAVLLLLSLVAGCGAMPDEYAPEEEPGDPMPTSAVMMPSSTPLSTATPGGASQATSAPATPTPISGEYEAAEGFDASTATALGELEVEYPQAMDPATSNTVKASVYIPAMLASAEPARFERVTVSNETAPLAGDLGLFQTTILINRSIRAEITSPTLTFEAIFPATQDVNLDATLDPTTWVWTILAPESAGEHTFVLSLFHGEDSVPAWVGSFTLDVTALVEPAPMLDPTPAPDPEPSFLTSLIDSSGDILAAALGLAAVIIPMIMGARSKRTGKGWKFWKK